MQLRPTITEEMRKRIGLHYRIEELAEPRDLLPAGTALFDKDLDCAIAWGMNSPDMALGMAAHMMMIEDQKTATRPFRHDILDVEIVVTWVPDPEVHVEMLSMEMFKTDDTGTQALLLPAESAPRMLLALSTDTKVTVVTPGMPTFVFEPIPPSGKEQTYLDVVMQPQGGESLRTVLSAEDIRRIRKLIISGLAHYHNTHIPLAA